MQENFSSSKTLNGLLYNQSKETKKGIRFIKNSNDEEFVSYAVFYIEVLKYLGQLQSQKGLNVGDEVIIYEEDNHKFLIGFWSCLLGGYIPVPVSIGGKKEHKLKFLRIYKDLNNPYVYSTKANLEKIASFGLEINLIEKESVFNDKFLDSSNALGGEIIGTPVERFEGDLAFIQYSSGSTGNPKGVELTHENLVYNVRDIVNLKGNKKEDAYLSWIPLTHDLGMIAFHLVTVLVGSNQLIMPTNLFIRRPLLWMQKAHEHQATKLCSPNFGYQYFLQSYNRNNNNFDWDLSEVKDIINGAEPISSKICSDFTTTLSKYKLPKNCIKPCYGLAEASVGVSAVCGEDSIKKYFVDRDSLVIGNKLIFEEVYIEGSTLEFINVGKVMESTEVAIHNENGASLEVNTLGFIDIRGKNVTRGYYKKPKATNEVFLKDNWLRTGDLGFLCEDGSLVITGRYKNMIILQGQNYYAHDIERIIIGTADISLGKVAVCGVSGSTDQKEKLLVFIYYKKKIAAFLDTIIAIQERLSDALGIIPELIIPVREIPKTTSGKVQHSFLLNKYEQGDFDEVIKDINRAFIDYTIENWMLSSNPMKSISNWLQEQSNQLLRLTDFNLNLNTPLSDQGFKSIHAVQLSQIIKTRLGVETPSTILYQYPTIHKLSEYIYEQLLSVGKKEHTSEDDIIGDNDILLNKIESLNEEDVLKILDN